jgi:hypothetical protein
VIERCIARIPLVPFDRLLWSPFLGNNSTRYRGRHSHSLPLQAGRILRRMNCPELAATRLGCAIWQDPYYLDEALAMAEMYSLVCGCHYAVQIPDDVDTVDVRYPQTRSSTMAGFPDLCNGTLGISPLPLDLISGAIYWCLARLALDWGPLLAVRTRDLQPF